MARALGVVMDPIAAIDFKKDTTLALLLAAQARGFDLWYLEQGDLYLEDGEPRARMRPLQVFADPARWFALGDPEERPLAALPVILMRKDPPFDSEYIYSTYLLEMAEERGSLVVNRPQSLRDCNEKLFAADFPDLAPPHLVSRDPARLKAFFQRHRDVVYKPLDAMGGASVFHVREGDTNLSVILEVLTQHGRRTIMAQRYLPAIRDGDKRILMVDGEAVPWCLARIPAAGESRGNLAAGGTGEVRPLTPRDREIAAAVGPVLRERGILFAGLDVIGDHLTEINVTSPTCAREIERATGVAVGEWVVDAIERRLAAASR